ncbi:MAG: cupin domain-containing protein [Bacteroidia bacterium]|jgi:hypothetical protein|nr:cupin domain-containing protein [Bacteroidia bacterium]
MKVDISYSSIEYIEGEKPSLFYSNSYRGEWLEVFSSGYSAYLKHSLFWQGSGYMAAHKHPNDTIYYKVLKGEATYYIENQKFKAKEGDVFCIPANTVHIDPFNSDWHLCVVVTYEVSKEYVDYMKFFFQCVESEKFAYNKGGLPTKKQLQELARRFPSAIQFDCIRWTSFVKAWFEYQSFKLSKLLTALFTFKPKNVL